MAHAFRARAIYGLQVPPGVFVPAHKYAAAIKITMAAIDPNEEVEEAEDKSSTPRIPRSTLKLVRLPSGIIDGDDDSDDEDFDPEELAKLIGDSEDSDEEEPSAGPSDPKKAKKTKQDAQLKALAQALKENDDEDSDEDMDDAEKDSMPNGKIKGKAKATESDEDDSEEDEDDISLDDDQEETIGIFNICTLDTERNYQQPIDIFVEAGEPVGFRVEGTHTVHLTGNIISYYDDEESDSGDDEEDGLYDLEPDMDELLEDASDEEDALDGVRVTEVDSDDEEAPKLVEAPQKGKKRPAEEEAESLDSLLKKEAEQKLSKKQLKKMKNNKGEAVSTKEETKEETKKEAKEEPKKEAKKDPKADKKVQFAKNLEQGPSGSEAKKVEKTTLGVKVVKGVTVDDRKIGNGRAVKNGDKVGVRYIGKLENGKVFDSNKKGKPFSFKVGKGEVIKGWEIGIVGMSIGGERRLTIPANLAYGSKGVPGIPANSTLIFDIKLLEIN